jgi:hypothetical protein
MPSPWLRQTSHIRSQRFTAINCQTERLQELLSKRVQRLWHQRKTHNRISRLTYFARNDQ